MILRSAARAVAFAFMMGLAAAGAQAHHTLAMYDQGKRVELTGTLTRARVGSPHSMFWLSVPASATGQPAVEWTLESGSVGTLMRSLGGPPGKRFAEGQTVHVTLNPSRDGARSGLLMRMQFADGQVMEVRP